MLYFKEISYMIIVPFLFVLCIIPFIQKVAIHVNAMDIPNGRNVHTHPMPRLGGLGIYFGFLLGYMIFGEHTAMMNSSLIGSFILIITGIFDDFKAELEKYQNLKQAKDWGM